MAPPLEHDFAEDSSPLRVGLEIEQDARSFLKCSCRGIWKFQADQPSRQTISRSNPMGLWVNWRCPDRVFWFITVKGYEIRSGVVMRHHEEFEWDAKKAKANIKKHKRVMFEDAMAVLADDDAHSLTEDRHVTIGSQPPDRRIVLSICWTDRWVEKKRVTRIISARHANGKEKIDDGEEISGR